MPAKCHSSPKASSLMQSFPCAPEPKALFVVFDPQMCRALGALPSPLWGGVGGGGREIRDACVAKRATPLPSPPPQGGREQTECAARVDSTSTKRALVQALPGTVT